MSEKKVDDDWKKRAEAEKEQLEHVREDVEKHLHDEEEGAEIPPASFQGLVATFALQASIALGQMPHPITQKRSVDLRSARYVIDMLAMLAEKTKGNLEHHESLGLNNLLTELRFRFVQAAQGSPAPGNG